MLGLRWTLGIITAVAALGLFGLAVTGGRFRRSFGASDSGVMTVLPVLVGAVVVASLLWPERRPLLHAVAVLMVGIVMGAVFIARHASVAATVAIVYASAWLFLYYRLVLA
ncbi:MAG TPA: hypothetical protein VKA54_03750 [Gemmatimonadaceae bacterium]|nr:hypothetical protein [Gemmatimonadaceae bacterium]